ncbi:MULTISPECIES: hypothetical protein [Bradyrhizobium]|uniref:Uncharacterized protein n=1 Tax=Bradyrhizobium brasilense TaxID=1419277 RepID=A0ABY8J4F3_9BRAD|nr:MULTISPECIES: hypothetical protein [Bradyrhizobium]KRP95119.1 hypothetical protein AOQ73_23795 [Bradyrhizobium pachyrhizi]MCP1833144.1 hypothetical protein [Bradyrhizobium sp. USDA 4545]MCP1917889.1 hypothetical protein [Bradyrhizobium sp. USDA 4532]NLS69674.1 hypothetical protein [Bradyrhizobium brasilense]WFU60395.1 hypothetical protein QA636_22815 [Bradyrhizobium brasilense]
MSDPTDNALAAIASILDQTTTPPEKAKSSDKTADKEAEPAKEPPVSIAMPPPLPSSVEVVSVETVSITTVSVEAAPAESSAGEPPPVEASEPVEQPEASKAEASEPEPTEPEPSQPEAEPESIQPPPQPIEANGYSKSGPGPMAALRFRWTVRQDGAQYYVDETVGEASTPLVNGPMERDAAIKFVDDREAQARRRFEHFKHEMLSRTASVVQASKDSNEA